MDIFLLLSYITGGLLVLVSLLIYVAPNRTLNLLMKACADLLSVINLIFVYLTTKEAVLFAGIGTTSIGFIREILFSQRSKYKALNHIAWPIGFSIIFLCSLFITYKSPLSLVPVIGSVITSISFYLLDQRLMKTGCIISSILYVTYYAILLPSSSVLTLFSLLSSASGFVSSLIGLIIVIRKINATKNKTNNT